MQHTNKFEIQVSEKISWSSVEETEKNRGPEPFDKNRSERATMTDVFRGNNEERDLEAIASREGVRRAARNMDYEAGTRPDLWMRRN